MVIICIMLKYSCVFFDLPRVLCFAIFRLRFFKINIKATRTLFRQDSRVLEICVQMRLRRDWQIVS